MWSAALLQYRRNPIYFVERARMKITGTFSDEITHDIPSTRIGGPKKWAADFDAHESLGVGPVILIRSGYRDRITFASEVLSGGAGDASPATPRPGRHVLRQNRGTAGSTSTLASMTRPLSCTPGPAPREVELNLRFTDEWRGNMPTAKPLAAGI